jgi:competence protein ComEC
MAANQYPEYPRAGGEHGDQSGQGCGGDDGQIWLPVTNSDDPNARRVREPPLEGPPSDDGDQRSISSALDRYAGQRSVQLWLELYGTSVGDWFTRQMNREFSERGEFLWVPVLFGMGCIVYFALPREPAQLAFPLAAFVALLLAWKLPRGAFSHIFLVALGLVCSGASMAQFRTAMVNTTMLDRALMAEVSSKVLKTEVRANGRVRYTLDVSAKSGTEGNEDSITVLRRIRLTARQGKYLPLVGDTIIGRARLGPPPGPAVPGGYDFSFHSWFNGIGAVGFFLGLPVKQAGAPSGGQSATLLVEQLRERMSLRLRHSLPGQTGALASALIIGDRGGIDDTTNEALRRAGLAHILAISGLHMGLVALTIVALVRRVLAFFPMIVLVHPVRKWAGVMALLCATGYLLLSGGNVSTQRAYAMTAIMLLAVILDRRALTMRNVAWAAIIVLVCAPEAVLQPGFQMSFAAVTALIGSYEMLQRRRSINTKRTTGWMATVGRLLRRNTAGLALTPLIAGLATAPFAAYHFYQVAPFGLVANILAMPIVSLAVMPLAMLSIFLMPFGLEMLALAPLGLALQAVVDIAQWVAQLGPRGVSGMIPNNVLLLGALSLLLATLARSQLKVLSIPVALLAVVFMGDRQQPDVIIAENGRQIGVVHSQQHLVLLKPNADKFTTKIWRQAYRVAGRPPDHGHQSTSNNQRPQCDDMGCTMVGSGAVLVHVRGTASLFTDCVQADIVVIPYRAPGACAFLGQQDRPVIIDKQSLQRHGAHALTIHADQLVANSDFSDSIRNNSVSVTLQRAYEKEVRPWTRHRFNN